LIEYLLFLIQFAAIGALLFLYRRLRARLAEVEAEAAPTESPELSASVAQLIAELKRTAAEIAAELTTKSAALERLLREAEAPLAGTAAVPPAPVPLSSLLAPAVPSYEAAQPRELEPVPLTPFPRREGRSRLPSPRGRGAGGEVLPVPSPAVEETERNRHEEALRLAREGWSSVQIARQVRTEREEVELLLGLYKETGRDPE